jgi:hypothetical protein
MYKKKSTITMRKKNKIIKMLNKNKNKRIL